MVTARRRRVVGREICDSAGTRPTAVGAPRCCSPTRLWRSGSAPPRVSGSLGRVADAAAARLARRSACGRGFDRVSKGREYLTFFLIFITRKRVAQDLPRRCASHQSGQRQHSAPYSAGGRCHVPLAAGRKTPPPTHRLTLDVPVYCLNCSSPHTAPGLPAARHRNWAPPPLARRSRPQTFASAVQPCAITGPRWR
jgi:hypothetical protein